MKVNDFIKFAVEQEGKKQQVAIAQVREIFKVANKMTKGALYKLIRDTKPDFQLPI